MKTSSVIALLGLLTPSAVLLAQNSPDWKLIGGTPDSYLFYDTQSIRRLADGHLEVWLKALAATSVEKAGDKMANDKDRVERIARKFADGYRPPLALTHKLTKTEIMNGVIDEEVANAAGIEPVIRMLVEIDCSNAMSRDLSLWVNKGGKSGSSQKITEWEHIAPETNFATLRLAICRTS